MAAERHSLPLMALGPSLVRSFVHFGLQEIAVAFGQKCPPEDGHTIPGSLVPLSLAVSRGPQFLVGITARQGLGLFHHPPRAFSII